MRISVFVPRLDGGGAERVAIELADAFGDVGHDVALVVATLEGELLGRLPASLEVVDLGATRVRSAVPALMEHLRDRRPDALLSFMSHANAVAAGAIAALRHRPRLVVTEHNFRSKALDDMGPVAARLMRLAMRATFRRADAVVGVSRGVTEDLVTRFGLERSKAVTIYNPIDRQRLIANAETQSGHSWLDEPGPPVVLGAGRLTKQKDFQSLIEAFAIVRAKRPARLIIVGEGGERPSLERAIDEHGVRADVRLPGFVRNVESFISRANVFALSSVREGLANVVAEALAIGTPVVATDCAFGPAEILESGRWGRVVPVSNPEALADGINDALDGKVPPAPAEATARFAPDLVTAAYLELLTPNHDPSR